MTLEHERKQIEARMQQLARKAAAGENVRDALEAQGRELARVDAALADARLRAAVASAQPTKPAERSYRSILRGEHRSSITSTDSQGGYLVPEEYVVPALESVSIAGALVGDARQIDATGQQKVRVPIQTVDAGGGWVTETGSHAQSTSPTYAAVTIECFELFTEIGATRTLIDSADAESEVTAAVAHKIGNLLDLAIATGSGIGQPTGIISGSYTAVASGSAGNFVAAKVLEGFYSLASRYHKRAKFYTTIGGLGKLAALERASGTGVPLVEFTPQGAFMLGLPIALDDNLPAVSAGNTPLILADMSQAYGIATSKRLTIDVDPFSSKPDVLISGYTRVGGAPLDTDAAILFTV